MKVALGIDIGGTNTKLGLVTDSGKVITHSKFQSHAQEPFDVFKRELLNAVNVLIHESGTSPDSIGIGAPNLNPITGHLERPVNLDWGDIPLKEEIQELFTQRVFTENDANIAAVGEKVFGAGKTSENFLVITLGTGVGSGAYVHNKLLHGHDGLGCEAGHLLIIPGGRECGCGGKGHLESYACVRGVEQTAFEETGLTLSFGDIFERFQKNDPEIIGAIKKTAYYLSLGLVQSQALILPERIILSGGVSNLGPKFLEYTKESFDKLCYPTFKGKTEILLSEVSLDHGAILGAAALAL